MDVIEESRDMRRGAPALGPVRMSMLGEALRRGFADLRAAPGVGLSVGGAAAIAGLVLSWVSVASGQTWWLLIVVSIFPMVAPFVAVGLYDVSRRREAGLESGWPEIAATVRRQGRGQVPSLGAVVGFVVLFWVFVAHLIFALFLGLSPMTNVSSSLEVFMTREGISMLAIGTVVGAAFAGFVYAVIVMAVPMLLDRDVDFVTAMLASLECVLRNPGPMLAWALFIAVAVTVAALPAFVGLVLVLPLLGHASWHLYRLAAEAGEEM